MAENSCNLHLDVHLDTLFQSFNDSKLWNIEVDEVDICACSSYCNNQLVLVINYEAFVFKFWHRHDLVDDRRDDIISSPWSRFSCCFGGWRIHCPNPLHHSRILSWCNVFYRPRLYLLGVHCRSLPPPP